MGSLTSGGSARIRVGRICRVDRVDWIRGLGGDWKVCRRGLKDPDGQHALRPEAERGVARCQLVDLEIEKSSFS